MSSVFSCKVQLAKHELDEVIEKGAIDFQGFLSEFDAIDWDFESDRLQFLNKTWPTIAVFNHTDGAILRVSSYRPLPPDFLDADEFRSSMAIWFIAKLDNPPNPPKIVDLGSRRALSECFFETYDMGEIEELFKDFFKNDYESLYESLYSMNLAKVEEA